MRDAGISLCDVGVNSAAREHPGDFREAVLGDACASPHVHLCKRLAAARKGDEAVVAQPAAAIRLEGCELVRVLACWGAGGGNVTNCGQMREILPIWEQMREIPVPRQMRETFEPCTSILPTHG